MKRFDKLISVLLVVAAAPTVFGSGFGLFEGSARGNALGGLTGSADDPAAIFFNPAGITQLDGVHLMAGVSLINPSANMDVTSIYGGSTVGASYEDNWFTPPHIYYTRQLNQKLWLGLGLYSRFGLGSEFQPGWEGRYSNVNTNIETLSFNTNLAVKIDDKLSIAFGLTYMWLNAEFDLDIDASRFMVNPNYNNPATSTFDVRQVIEGQSFGYGYNLAVHFRPVDKWSFGLSYISEVQHDVDEGVAHFTKPAAPLPPTWFVDSNVVVDTIDLPSFLFLGTTYKFSDKMTLSAGAIQTGWSSLQQLVFNYETPFLVIPGLGLSLDTVSRDLNWKDVWRYHFGAEHHLGKDRSFLWSYSYDESPIPDSTVSYLLPANNRNLIGLGYGFPIHLRNQPYLVELSYTYLWMESRDIPQRQLADGILETEITDAGAHILGFSISRKL
jgi:long-chain fatty acid transport protein